MFLLLTKTVLFFFLINFLDSAKSLGKVFLLFARRTLTPSRNTVNSCYPFHFKKKKSIQYYITTKQFSQLQINPTLPDLTLSSQQKALDLPGLSTDPIPYQRPSIYLWPPSCEEAKLPHGV